MPTLTQKNAINTLFPMLDSHHASLLSREIANIVEECRICLKRRGFEELEAAKQQLILWRKSPLNKSSHMIDALLLKEGLANLVGFDDLVAHLLKMPPQVDFKKYEYVALMTLSKVSVLLLVMREQGNNYGQESLKIIQSYSSKIAVLHTALRLFRHIDALPLDEQDAFAPVLNALRSRQGAKVATARHDKLRKVKDGIFAEHAAEIQAHLERYNNKSRTAKKIYSNYMSEEQRKLFPEHNKALVAYRLKYNGAEPERVEDLLDFVGTYDGIYAPIQTIAGWLKAKSR